MTAEIVFAERGDKAQLEEGKGFAPKFDDNGLITAIAVDHESKEILMVAYMNEVSLKRSLECGQAVYWSRSRKKFWHKGEESGNVQNIKRILTDCDQDCLIVEVEQIGGAACHTGRKSCFYRAVDFSSNESPVSMTEIDSEKVFDPKAVYKK